MDWDLPSKKTGVGPHFPSPGDLPNPGIKASSPTLQVHSSTAEQPGKFIFPLMLSDQPVHTQLLQSGPTLCNPMDRSPPGSCVRGILQARILSEWACLLQGIFPNHGLRPHLLHCRPSLCCWATRDAHDSSALLLNHRHSFTWITSKVPEQSPHSHSCLFHHTQSNQSEHL